MLISNFKKSLQGTTESRYVDLNFGGCVSLGIGSKFGGRRATTTNRSARIMLLAGAMPFAYTSNYYYFYFLIHRTG